MLFLSSGSSCDNVIYCTNGNLKSKCKSLCCPLFCGPQNAYFFDLLGRQFCAIVVFTVLRSLVPRSKSALIHGISNVISSSSSKEMSRVAAPSKVAAVANKKAIGNFAIGERIGYSAGLGGSLSLASIKHSVAPWIYSSGPRPARIRATGFVNVFPESLLKRLSACVVPADKASWYTFFVSGVSVCIRGYCSALTAAAFAVSSGFRGIVGVCGIISTHLKLILSDVTLPAVQAAREFLFAETIISHNRWSTNS